MSAVCLNYWTVRENLKFVLLEIEMKRNRLLDKIQKQLKLFAVSWLVSSFNNKLIGLKGLKVWFREGLRERKLIFFKVKHEPYSRIVYAYLKE